MAEAEPDKLKPGTDPPRASVNRQSKPMSRIAQVMAKRKLESDAEPASSDLQAEPQIHLEVPPELISKAKADDTAEQQPKRRKQVTKADRPPPDDARIPRQPLRIVQARVDKLVKRPQLRAEILTVVLTVHKLAIHCYQFIALYMTSLLEANRTLPTINQEFVVDVSSVITHGSNNTRPRSILTKATDEAKLRRFEEHKLSKAALQEFFNTHYQPTMVMENLDVSNLQNTIQAMATEMVTAINNNIQQHYNDYRERFLNTLYSQTTLSDEEKKAAIKHDRQQLKMGQLGEIPASSPIFQHKHRLLPARGIAKNNVNYDIKATPQDYLIPMFYMLRVLETAEAKLFQLFPLRTQIIPKSVRIDTTTLINRFMTPDEVRKLGLGQTKEEARSHLSACHKKVWSELFKTDLHCFAPARKVTDDKTEATRFKFDYSIVTDGFTCCVQQRLKSDDPVYKAAWKDEAVKALDTTQHIDNCSNPEALRGMKIVGIDPGKQDLLYCAMPLNPDLSQGKPKGLKEISRLRYSAAQRKYECCSKRQRKRLERAVHGSGLIKNKTVEQWQHELSFFKRKTTSSVDLKAYITRKNLVNSKLIRFWASDQFRMMKWQNKVNAKRSEALFMNRFKEKFGEPKDTLVAIGNWSENKPKKFNEPTKGKSFRKMFRCAGYKLYLVNEFRTSIMDYNCEIKLKDKFKKVKNPKPKPKEGPPPCPFAERCGGCLVRDEQRAEWAAKKKQNGQRGYRKTIRCHGLLMCETCRTYWNRDLNGALNIQYAAWSIVHGLGRPSYLCPEPKASNVMQPSSSSSVQELQEEKLDTPETGLLGLLS